MIAFPKTHDLELLLNLVASAVPQLEVLRDAAKLLSDYAVELRYPGPFADAESAKKALASCQRVRGIVRQSLKLAP